MNVLVTGGTGFLGTALCSRLAAEGHAVVRLGSRDADLTRGDVTEVALALPAGVEVSKGTLELDPERKLHEITRLNNRVELE